MVTPSRGQSPAQRSGTPTVLGEHPASHEPGFLELFRPHAGKLAQGLVWLALTNGLLLAVPRLVNEGIAVVEGTAGESRSMLSLFGIAHPSIVSILLALVVAAVIGGVARVFSRVILFNIGRDIERSLREVLFAHLSTLSPTYFRKSSVGDLMSRLTNDMTNVRLMAGFALLNALNAAIVFAATLPLLFALDVRVAGLALLPFPLVLVAAQSVSKVMFRRTRQNQEILGKLTGRVQENLAGQQVVRAFSREDAELKAFARVNDELFNAALRLATVRIFMGPLMGLMGTLGIGIALWSGGQAIVAGRLDIGDVVEINTRLIQLMWPTIAMGFILSVYQRGKASIGRIHEVLRARPDIVDGPVDRAVEGRIEARKLTVEVAPGKNGLVDLDVVVDKARVLGIVGKTGAGKSTLLRALARQLPCPRDQVFLDDVDVNDWHLSALHAGVGVVPEDGFLFSLTLRENLAFGRPDASEREIEDVVDLCDLRRDVNAFPDGLATLVGERGVTLSGGQRQRVALARAILSRPAVLLLDDSLSAVDAETEAKIVAGLRAGFGQAQPPTLIVVSHRLSAVKEADEIIALDAGRVVERGTHDELLKKGGLYADLWGIEQLKKALAGKA